MPLVINSRGGRHTHNYTHTDTHRHTDIQTHRHTHTHLHRNNVKKAGMHQVLKHAMFDFICTYLFYLAIVTYLMFARSKLYYIRLSSCD